MSRDPSDAAPPRDLSERSDDELMALLSEPEAHAAFATLSRRHMGKTLRFCARMVGDPRIAEELAQETWLRIWASRDRYAPSGKFTPFLYTVARHRCLNDLRDRTRRGDGTAEGLPAAALSSGDDSADRMIAKEREARLSVALAKLPEPMRAAVVLRLAEGLTYEDMAALLDAPEVTLRSRVFHAVKRLRTLLAKGGTDR
jgi:RNA polymerase sigma-70 factor (ECF subfamily)